MGEVEVLGLFLSIVGVLALVFPELTEAKVPVEGKATGAELAVYVIAGIVSVCAYGIGTAISQGILEYHNIKEYDATLYANFFGSIFILIESLILDVLLGNQVGESLFGISNAGWTGWGYLILYTLSSSIICNMMFMWLLKKLGAKTALNTILVRLFALFFGIMFNNEWAGYSWWDAKIQIVGACISLFGLLCMLRKELDYVEESDSSGSSFSERKASFDGVEL
jgi:drug/metabolite transporter (DMT)-like permease